jgi:hypothetical protein
MHERYAKNRPETYKDKPHFRERGDVAKSIFKEEEIPGITGIIQNELKMEQFTVESSHVFLQSDPRQCWGEFHTFCTVGSGQRGLSSNEPYFGRFVLLLFVWTQWTHETPKLSHAQTGTQLHWNGSCIPVFSFCYP